METNISESISARLVSDKPIKKTPYQVKGVFMKQFSDEKIVPFLDGKLRSKYLYPRVQVKILDEQVYIVGINEGVDPVLSLVDNLEFFNFGDITVKIEKIDVEQNQNPVSLVDKLLRYKFVTPWVALNAGSSKKFKGIEEDNKNLFLNKLLGQNLLFLSKELGLNNQVLFLKNISTELKNALVAKSHVFVMPSISYKKSVEGFGIAYVEAAQFGIPSIGGKDGGASDAIKHNETGLICDGNNLDDIYSSIDLILKNNSFKEFGQKAKEFSLNFHWDKIIKEYLKLL